MKDKKKLTANFKQPDAKIIIMGVAVLCLIIGSLFLVTGGRKQATPEDTAGINFTVPDPSSDAIGNNRLRSLDMVGKENTSENMLWGDEKKPVEPAGESFTTYRNVTAQVQAFDQSSGDKETIRQLQQEIDQLNSRLDRQDRPQLTPEQVMEQSYSMAARLMGGDKAAVQTSEVTDLREKLPVRTFTTADNLVSSLGGISLAEFVQENRQTDFITPVGQQPARSTNTIAACIDHEQTLTSGGPVKIRILDNIIVGDYPVPVNSVLTGTAVLGSNQRLEIKIEAIEMNGNIVPVELVVHDNDGQKGLYIPVSSGRTAVKDAAGAMTNSFGSGISISRDAKQQVAMDVARGAITGGSQYLSSKIREVRITLKPDYKVLLISSK